MFRPEVVLTSDSSSSMVRTTTPATAINSSRTNHTQEGQARDQDLLLRKEGSSSDSEDEKRTSSTASTSVAASSMDDEGGQSRVIMTMDQQQQQQEDQREPLLCHREDRAFDNISMAETASDQLDDDELFGENGSNNPSEFLAERETRAVSWLRVTVLAIMAAATILVSTTLYYTSSKAQETDFAHAFDDAANKLMDSLETTWQLRCKALGGFALDLASFAEHVHEDEASWPRVTFPDFARRAESTLSLVNGASSMVLLPLVPDDQRTLWEEYSTKHAPQWLIPTDTIAQTSVSETPVASSHLRSTNTRGTETHRSLVHQIDPQNISKHIFNFDGPSKDGTGPFAPVWQTFPVTENISSWVNMDLLSVPSLSKGLERSILTQTVILEQVANLADSTKDNEPKNMWELLSNAIRGDPNHSYANEPFSPLYYPLIQESFTNTNNLQTDNNQPVRSPTVVSVVMSMMYWRFYFENVLQPSAKGITVVVQNECNQSFSYRVDGKKATFLGKGDHHESDYENMVQTVKLSKDMLSEDALLPFGQTYCPYSVSVYPTARMRNDFVSFWPLLQTFLVILFFGLAVAVFYIYDVLVERRQKVVMDQAMQSNAIVSSLFPEAVRDRLFGDSGENGEAPGGGRGSLTNSNGMSCDQGEQDNYNGYSGMGLEPAAKTRLKSFLNNGDAAGAIASNQMPTSGTGGTVKPIADLFPNCTVLFADISGFTAWSSLRDPAQVFTLLENIYHSFDQIARKRNVFKVETVGDSYVAVTGLPDPQEDHAIVMAKFARDCRVKMNEVTRQLELTLGPDTGDLRMRFGLHSGPVTAGVLRGERSRFQLFGDTVNTAARMESTGERDRIQCSQSTADILTAEGKGHWLRTRDKKVHAKGKGEMQTYWIEIISASKEERRNSDHSQLSGDTGQDKSNIWGSEEEIPESVTQRAKHQRLIDYNVDLLSHHLKRIVARRNAMKKCGRRCSQGGHAPVIHEPSTEVEGTMPLDEVTEVIRLPNFDATAVKGYVDPDSIDLPKEVTSQLKRYVSVIGAMYRQNPFHNFEHASHVVMSVNKLLQRVVAPSIDFKKSQDIEADLHNYTYGITSDAIAQFAVVFAALIHDVDHWGVSNGQLMKEGAPMAEKYKNKSIAEQNSVDLAWDLLMDPDEYGDLQKCIFTTDAEYQRFRQIVVNLVMATDIFDKELGELRKNRWAKAFSKDNEDVEEDEDMENRKATVVIEHIMQASDVAHTMQHWHVYQKWNRRLFDELYTAWRAGRMGADPSSFWYDGEMKFFDSYIIPLARKLKDCGVFGVASDECLNYAIDNRKEWEAKGQALVADIIADYEQRDREDALRKQAEEQAQQNGTASRKKKNRFSRRRSLIATGG